MTEVRGAFLGHRLHHNRPSIRASNQALTAKNRKALERTPSTAPCTRSKSAGNSRTRTQKTVPFSTKGTEPGATATRARPTPPSPPKSTNARPRSHPPTPWVAGRAPAPPLAPGAVTALPTASSAAAPPRCWPNQRRHYHPRTHRGDLGVAPTPATHKPAPPNCYCREEHQVKWRRPGEPNTRICSCRTGIGAEKQTAGIGQHFFSVVYRGWPGCFSSLTARPGFRGDVQSFDELEHATPARAKDARALERRHERHRECEVGRRGHNRRTYLLCKSHEVVDPQAKFVVYHLAHDIPRRGAREQDNIAKGVPA